jgi:hypothetical protein
MIATVLTEIRTDQLPNMGIECYHYSSPFSIYFSRKLCISKWSSHHIFSFQKLQHTISYLGFAVHLAVIMKSITFWDVKPRSLVYVNWCFRGTQRLHSQSRVSPVMIRFLLVGWLHDSFSDPEDGGSTFLQNVSKLLPNYITHPRILSRVKGVTIDEVWIGFIITTRNYK